MSGRDPLAALQKLAALKAQRALADLAAARARVATEAQAVSDATQAARETYAPSDGGGGGEMQQLWRRRVALDAEAAAHEKLRQRREREAAEVEARAAQEVARELGARAMLTHAASLRAKADARRHERSMGVLAALKGPGRG